MSVRIRLRRQGAHKQPTYRVVVADARAPRNGKFIEIIGHYNPRTQPTTIVINEQKALLWLGRGAQPTEVVSRLMKKVGILDRFEAAKRGETVPTTAVEASSATPAPETAQQAQATTEPETVVPASRPATETATSVTETSTGGNE